ncbi:hypothetical protein Tsubulata_021426 [Turnera subulata]|uniref:Bet v I/Major latex protein domain-containing protein n=1 Tax=Turnera subulata TaxID=218843 RepID=A0A9Q0G253_9ROSI|nr:hypothetical protein Tsubulata_021426 [Turnera subulata]
MSLKGNLEAEVELKTDAKTIHDVFSGRPHHISNMTPERIQGFELHEGDLGTPGTILTWSYLHEGIPKIAKEVVEAIDDVNLSTTFKVIKGDLLTEYKDFKTTVKATPRANGEGTIAHWHFEYEKLHEGIPDPHSLLDFTIHLTKDIDDHHVNQANKVTLKSSQRYHQISQTPIHRVSVYFTWKILEMSLQGSMEVEVEIKTDAITFHDLFTRRPHHISIMSPENITGVEVHDGDFGTEGATLMCNYVHAGFPMIAKELIEVVDDVNFSSTYRMIEGDLLKHYKVFKTTVKATPKASGEGSMVLWHYDYEKLNEGIPDPHPLLEYATNITKDIEGYLVNQANK